MRRKREYTELGLWAKAAMAELNMTQAELADAMHVTSASLTDIFTGRTKRSPIKEAVREYLLAEVKRREEKRAV